MKSWRINERIRSGQIRVIGEDGTQLGILSPADALRMARERGLDLVEVAPQTNPPVCRILDFNKFKYEEQKRERVAKRKHHVTKLKEVKFKPRIEAHDYQVKLGMLRKFLIRGDQAKVTMVYRGREMSRTEIGRRVLERLIEDLKPISKVERNPSMEGRFLSMIFGPDREGVRRWLAKEEAERKKALEMEKTSNPPVEAQSPAMAGHTGDDSVSTPGAARASDPDVKSAGVEPTG